MNKKNAAAVIEIGTDSVRMRVCQFSKGAVSTLDHLEYPVQLGHDVFEMGSISFENLRTLSAAVEKFSQALLSYNITKPRVVSCTALRDAKNRSLVVDQLRVRNDVEVTVLEDSPEKATLYSHIVAKLEGTDCLGGGNSVIAHVGSGSIGVAVYDGSRIVYFQNISMGATKLQDILQNMHRSSQDFHIVVEEYLDTILNRVALGEFPIHNLIFTGTQIELVAKLCGAKRGGEVYQVGVQSLTELYRSLRSLLPEAIALRYGIPEHDAAVLYTALAIYRAMLRFCPGAQTVCAPTVDIPGAVARCLLAPKAEAEREAFFRKSAIACAENTARRFGCDLTHSKYIRDCCGRLFDKLSKMHGLPPSKRLILELAAILHSCGSFVSVRQHNQCTYDLIKGMDLFGLTEAEVLETAFVAGSVSDELDEHPDFSRLSVREKLAVSKLSAIFRLANALDKSHRQKLQGLKASIEEDRVLIKASAAGDTLLEQWAFEEAAPYFRDVFGLSPVLAVKFKIL